MSNCESSNPPYNVCGSSEDGINKRFGTSFCSQANEDMSAKIDFLLRGQYCQPWVLKIPNNKAFT
jgi:hypothetical protein